jgi:hypothetical protein
MTAEECCVRGVGVKSSSRRSSVSPDVDGGDAWMV